LLGIVLYYFFFRNFNNGFLPYMSYTFVFLYRYFFGNTFLVALVELDGRLSLIFIAFEKIQPLEIISK